ncbi:hypothetical protein [uncultured Alistipes sp.]|nr:hypothetical protein [uncultured Alistipes sp.]
MHQQRDAGHPAKSPFDPARDISKDMHRAAMDAVSRRAVSAATARIRNG